MEFIFGFGVAAVPRSRAHGARGRASRSAGSTSAPATATSAWPRASELPGTQFDGLDLSDSDRRGQAARLGRHARTAACSPTSRPTLAGPYDAVSMSHYLEHTLDPRKARSRPRTPRSRRAGALLIEVPDPEFVLGKRARQVLAAVVPAAAPALRLGREPRQAAARARLRAARRGIAARRISASTSSSRSWLLLDRIAPPREAAVAVARRARGSVANRGVGLGAPFIVVGIAVDNLVGPLWARGKISNTYRVVARKTG